MTTKLNPGKPRWKRIGIRSYALKRDGAEAYVFGAHRPDCLWALSVYWRQGHFGRVENGFARAKKRAEECISDCIPKTDAEKIQ